MAPWSRVNARAAMRLRAIRSQTPASISTSRAVTGLHSCERWAGSFEAAASCYEGREFGAMNPWQWVRDNSVALQGAAAIVVIIATAATVPAYLWRFYKPDVLVRVANESR